MSSATAPSVAFPAELLAAARGPANSTYYLETGEAKQKRGGASTNAMMLLTGGVTAAYGEHRGGAGVVRLLLCEGRQASAFVA